MSRIRKLLWLMMTITILLPSVTFADRVIQDDYDSVINDTVWYAPGYQQIINNCTNGNDTNLTGKDNVQKAFNFLVGKGLSANQAAGVVGNLQAESFDRIDPTANQDGSTRTTPLNGVGFGISQWTFTSRQAPLVALAQKMKLPATDLGVQLNFLWAELTGTVDPPYQSDGYKSVYDDLKKASTVDDATSLYMRRFESPADQSQSAINGRIAKAKIVLAKYGSGQTAGSTTTDTTGSTCQNGNGVIGGDVVTTALNLAWRPGEAGFSLSVPKPAYKIAWDGASDYTDCGAFVASVMIATGADKNYPKVSTAVQLAYVKSHPEKYQIINHPTNTGQLQPGDILVFSASPYGHTIIYLGPQKNGYVVAAASLGDHVPILQTAGALSSMFSEPGIIAAHIIK